MYYCSRRHCNFASMQNIQTAETSDVNSRMKMLSPNANLWLVLSLIYTVLREYINPKTSLTFKLFHSAA